MSKRVLNHTKELMKEKSKYKWALLLGIMFLLTYMSTMPRFNVGYADSDELLSVANNLGVAHPPGYPLFILLLYRRLP